MSQPPGQSRALIEALCSDDVVTSEAAAARLVITGLPAVRHLLKALDGAAARDMVRMLGVLERIGAPSARPTLVDRLQSPDDAVAAAAAAALGSLLNSPDADTSAATLDHLAAAALDTARRAAVRLAAFEALQRVEDTDAIALVRAQLLADDDPQMRAAARGEDATGRQPQSEPAGPLGEHAPLEVLDAAATGAVPDDPAVVRQAVAAAGASASLTTLHRLIEQVRAHTVRHPDMANDWEAVRAAVHLALAERDSRIAVYDLRDMLAGLGASTPVAVLSALQRIGDPQALEAIADAWSAAEDGWFRTQLTSTFQAIVLREGLTRRHGIVRRLAQRVPASLDALWPAGLNKTSRSRPSQRPDAP